MSSTAVEGNGEYRRLTSEEVGSFVKAVRRSRGIKRAVLAVQAGISEKTLERVEAGTLVQDESYRRLAVALGMPEAAFTQSGYVPTPEEAAARLERQEAEFLAKNMEVAVRRLEDARSVLSLFPSHGLLVDDRQVSDEHMEAVAALKDLLSDWGDVLGELPEGERLKAAKYILEQVATVERFGYCVKAGVASGVRTKSGVGLTVSVVVAFSRRTDSKGGPSAVWVPREMSI